MCVAILAAGVLPAQAAFFNPPQAPVKPVSPTDAMGPGNDSDVGTTPNTTADPAIEPAAGNIAAVVEREKLVPTNLGGTVAVQPQVGENPPIPGRAATFVLPDPGTDAPATYYEQFPCDLTPFPLHDEDPPPGSDVTEVPIPCKGFDDVITFSIALNHRRIQGSGGYGWWGSWSHGYMGDVYYTNGATSVTITLPAAQHCGFYFYVEPNPFADIAFTAVTDDGTSSGSFIVNGSSGARFVGVHGGGILSVTISTDDGATDFSIGEFGICCICEGEGACCDPYTGDCEDGVDVMACVGMGFQPVVDQLCADLDPACGNPGACCDEDAGICTTELALDCIGPRFAAGAPCDPDPFDPPCGEWVSVGVLYCPSNPDNSTYRADLSAALLGSPVDYFDPRVATPTLDLLMEYACVQT